MKIEYEGSLLRLKPENDREKQDLNKLWGIVVDCARMNKKLVPVGEYVIGKTEVATFNIE